MGEPGGGRVVNRVDFRGTGEKIISKKPMSRSLVPGDVRQTLS